jgi:hypothetical protein
LTHHNPAVQSTMRRPSGDISYIPFALVSRRGALLNRQFADKDIQSADISGSVTADAHIHGVSLPVPKLSVQAKRGMHKGAAALHRRRPLADARASLRRVTHPNEAKRGALHQFRAASSISRPTRARAAAALRADKVELTAWHVPCSTRAASHAG